MHSGRLMSLLDFPPSALTVHTLAAAAGGGGSVLDGGAAAAATAQPPIAINFRILLAFAAFLLPYLAFLVVLPGVRERRVVSFITITIQLAVGVLLMAALILPYWKVGEATVVSHFQSHSRQRHQAMLGVNVGLDHINVTLKYIQSLDRNDQLCEQQPFRGLYLNERYNMDGVNAMTRELYSTYRRGLPYPLLKVMEYFSLSQGAFAWGRLYRNAGYYTQAVLWFSFAVWLLQCVILALVPHHYGKAGIVCGALALLANCVFAGNTPTTDVRIPFETLSGETTFLVLRYGACFYICFVAGVVSMLFGLVLSILQFLRLYSIATCLSCQLDDTVGPKCRWSHPHRRRSSDSAMITDATAVANATDDCTVAQPTVWTLSSASSSTSGGSTTSSTSGDDHQTETYITDETASVATRKDATPPPAYSRKAAKISNKFGGATNAITSGSASPATSLTSAGTSDSAASSSHRTPASNFAKLQGVTSLPSHISDEPALNAGDGYRRVTSATGKWGLPPIVVRVSGTSAAGGMNAATMKKNAAYRASPASSIGGASDEDDEDAFRFTDDDDDGAADTRSPPARHLTAPPPLRYATAASAIRPRPSVPNVRTDGDGGDASNKDSAASRKTVFRTPQLSF